MSSIITRGVRNNNPLNIKISSNKWIGKKSLSENTDKTFEQFDLMEHGIRAGIIVLRTYINKHHLYSVDSIIMRFCPECEQNLHNYSTFIKQHLKRYGFTDFDIIVFGSECFKRMVQAMMLFESRLEYPLSAITWLMEKYKL